MARKQQWQRARRKACAIFHSGAFYSRYFDACSRSEKRFRKRYDLRQRILSRPTRNGTFAWKGYFLGTHGGERRKVGKDRYHLSISVKRPGETALVRASDFTPLFPQRETPGPSCRPGRHVTFGRTYESRIRRYSEFDCRFRSVNESALLERSHSHY